MEQSGFVLMTPVGQLPALYATLTQLRAVNSQGDIKDYWFDTSNVLKRLLEATYEEDIFLSNGAKLYFCPSAWGDAILVRYEQRELSFWVPVQEFVDALKHVRYEYGIMHLPVAP